MPDTNPKAFALKDTVDDFAGGSTTYGDGLTLNFGELLSQGGGTIVTDDPDVIAALEGVHTLKSVAVPSGAADTTTTSPKGKGA